VLRQPNLPTADFSAMYKAGNGQQYEAFSLPSDLTETLITGYSTPLRRAVVVRLRELEAQVAKPPALALPNFSYPAGAARAVTSE
jgi:hypothetical protein